MRTETNVDFGLRSADYAEHRPGFPASFYERLERYFSLSEARALDLGTGPGLVAIELARRGARVLGIDIAENQLAAASARARTLGLDSQVRFEQGSAEATELEDGSIDLITAGQCWHWFDHPRALAEAARVLAPGGHLVVAHYCYLPDRSELAAQSEDLVLRYNPKWKFAGWNGIYAYQIDALQSPRFALVEQFCYDESYAFGHEAWRGRMRTCNGVGSGGMSEADVERYDHDLAELLRTRFPREPIDVPHRIWAVICERITPGAV